MCLKRKLIRLLGGIPRDEYAELEEGYRELEAQSVTNKKALDYLITFVGWEPVKISWKENVVTATVFETWPDKVPAEFLKRSLEQKLANELFLRKLVRFDLTNGDLCDGPIQKIAASVRLVEPQEVDGGREYVRSGL